MLNVLKVILTAHFHNGIFLNFCQLWRDILGQDFIFI